MFVRLTIADVKEGEINNALEYVKNTVIPSYDGLPGLLGLAACETNDGRFMAWSTWANEGAKEASIDKFNQALAGAADMLAGQPDVTEGSMVAGQQYIAVSKDGGDRFFARFVLGGGTQEGKTYDDVAEFMTNTVYPAYENVEGIYGAGACKVAEDKGFSFNFWTDQGAANGASDVIASVVSEAVENLISEPPQEITGQCDIWRNYVDFPVGKL
jgi:quinol monooxygenase YgiN